MNTKVLNPLLSFGNKINDINWSEQPQIIMRKVGVPLFAISVFLFIWGAIASQIQTSLGEVPGPAKVWQQAMVLVDEHYEERDNEKAFYERQDKRNAKKLEKDPNAKIKTRPYTGKSTFFDQIITSIITVATGFLLASLIAIPVGIVCGLSTTIYTALNPLIQTLFHHWRGYPSLPWLLVQFMSAMIPCLRNPF